MSSSRSVRLTTRAERALRRIRRYPLQTRGPEKRDAYEARLVGAMRDLALFPEMGRSRDDLGHGIRSHSVEQHVIFYRLRGDVLRVVRILRGKMESVGRL